MPLPPTLAWVSLIEVRSDLLVPEVELEFRSTRSGGPGGQHVNTSDTKVELRWSVATSSALSSTQRDRLRRRLASRLTVDDVLVLTGSEHRSQTRNREAVRARFVALLREAAEPPKARRGTRPSAAARRRRREAKQRRAETKQLRRRPLR